MTSNYNLNFLGNDTFINNEIIFNNFDINYLPIQNLPLSYYNLASRLNYSNIILQNYNNINDKHLTIIESHKVEKELNFNDNYNYIKIKDTTNITINSNLSGCSLLLVGGGGGGNNSINGGGGGGGEIIELTNQSLNAGNYSIIIGNGGNANLSGENTIIKLNSTIIYEARGGKGSIDNNGGDSVNNKGGLSYFNNGGGGAGNKFNNINDNIKDYFNDTSITNTTILNRFNYIGVSGKQVNNFGKELYLGGGGNGAYNNNNNLQKYIYINTNTTENINNYDKININNEFDLVLSKGLYNFNFLPTSINITGTNYNYTYKNNYILTPSNNQLKLWLKFDNDFLKNDGSLNININNSNCLFDTNNFIKGSGSLSIPYKNKINTTIILSPIIFNNYTTISLWIYIKKNKPQLTTNSFKNIVSFISNVDNEITIKFKAINNTENKLIFSINSYTYNEINFDNFDKWNNIVWVIDNTTKKFIIYFNNNKLIDSNYSIYPIDIIYNKNQYNSNYIGDFQSTSSIIKSEVNINISDFRYYNTLLTPTEVNFIYSGYISLFYINKEINLKGGGGKTGNKGIKNTGGGGGGGIKNIDDLIETNSEIKYISNTNDYYISFINTGINFLKLNKSFNCDILIIGGGGGGGQYGGSGGAGGVVYMTNKIIKEGYYKIIVGNGGLNMINGEDSKITEYISDKLLNYDNIDLIGKGGGRGGEGRLSSIVNTNVNSLDGGSGGGSGTYLTSDHHYYIGTLTGINKGGLSTQGYTYWNGKIYIAGGANGFRINDKNDYGDDGGGIEVVNNITGINTTYAIGGKKDITAINNIGMGGSNTGSGGSGIIIIRFKDIYKESNNSGGSGLVIIKYPKSNTLINLTDSKYITINELGNELDVNLKKLNNNEKPYNRFNIGYMRLIIIIIWIFIILFILRYLSYHFPEIYIYFIISIIIIILSFSSLWFLYVNNELIL